MRYLLKFVNPSNTLRRPTTGGQGGNSAAIPAWRRNQNEPENSKSRKFQKLDDTKTSSKSWFSSQVVGSGREPDLEMDIPGEAMHAKQDIDLE